VTSRAQQVAAQWSAKLAFYNRFGMLCYGCGYRIPPRSWVLLEHRAELMCPYCHTVRGTV